MAIREGRWDCPSCGSRGIYGRHVDCPGCGKPRPAGIRFYLTDDAPVITSAAQLAEAKAGADWACEHCGASNRATVTDCGGCGAPRGSSPAQRVVDYKSADVPRSGDAPPPPAAAPQALAAQPPKTETGPKPPRRPPTAAESCMGCGCLSLIVVVVMSVLVGIINGDGSVGGEDLTPAMVTGKRWERSFVVEQRRVQEGRGWDLPDSAEVVRTERRRRGWGQEVDHYETVSRPVRRSRRVADGTRTRTREVDERVRTGERTYVCGQRDLGNGYFEDIECTEPVYETRTRTETYEEPTYRTEYYTETETSSVPVYRRVAVFDTFFTYRAATWDSVEGRRTQGDTTKPVWPDTTLRPGQRIARRRQEYRMGLLRAGGTPLGMKVEFPVFNRFRVGQRVALRQDGRNPQNTAVFPADSLAACRRWHRGRGDPPPDSLGCTAVAERPLP